MERIITTKRNDGMEVEPFSTLTAEEKHDNLWRTNALFKYLNEHRGERLGWKLVNNMLNLKHVYKWKIDEYNWTHNWTKVCYDDKYVWIEDVPTPNKPKRQYNKHNKEEEG